MFDLDETLINSTIDFQKIKTTTIRYLSSLGILYHNFSTKMKTFKIVERAIMLLKNKGFSDLESSSILQEISKLWNKIELENIDKTTSRQGVREALQQLKEKKLKIGVITRSCREYALKALKVACLLEYIDVIVARDDFVKSKPHAEPLVHAMKTIGSKPEETIMIGDSIIDFQCAKYAGVKFIGINPNNSLKKVKDISCFTIIQDLQDIVSILK